VAPLFAVAMRAVVDSGGYGWRGGWDWCPRLRSRWPLTRAILMNIAIRTLLGGCGYYYGW
jgi:hypothetical protein